MTDKEKSFADETIVGKGSQTGSSYQEQEIIFQSHNRLSRFLLAQRHVPKVPDSRTPCPGGTTNIISILTFAWVGGLIRTGYTRVLEINDVWTQNDHLKIEKSIATFNRKYREYKERDSTSPYLKAIAYALRFDFFMMCVVFAVYATGEICLSVISRPTTEIIAELYEGQLQKRNHAIAYACGNTLVNLGFIFGFVWFQYYSRYYSEIVRSLIIAAIYEKIVLLSPHGRSQYPANRITALVTADTNRVYMAARWTVALFLFFPAVGAMIGILIDNLGVSALPGLGLILIGLFLNIVLSRFIAKFRRRSIPFSDKRIATVRDTLENMRVIKYYGWENSFVKLISQQRKEEAGLLGQIGRVTGCIDASTTSVPLFAGMLAFAIVSILKGKLDPARVFPSLTLFTIFIPMSMFFSNGVNTHADAWPSLLRIEAFFNADEEGHYVEKPEAASEYAVEIMNASFTWESNIPVKDQAKFRMRVKNLMTSSFRKADNVNALPETASIDIEDSIIPELKPGNSEAKELEKTPFTGLKNVNLKVRKGELILVVGTIGSGKSSLLSCIAGEMCKTKGRIVVDGKVTAVMSNWSLNATIRENILFGKEYEAQKYAEVTHVCSLESDFSAFDGRDFSEIGERGITLSGGQKARLALARGVYNAGDVILLDDVLSAVDSKVGKQIFDKCVNGYIKNTTRIMATHNWKQLPAADRIFFLDGSGNVAVGTLEELLNNNKRFNEQYHTMSTKKGSDGNEIDDDIKDDSDTEEEFMSNSIQKIPTIEPELMKKQLSRAPVTRGQLIQREARKQGSVKGYVVRKYLSVGSKIGAWFLVIIVLCQAALGTASVMQSVWLNWWSADRYHQPKGWYVGFYALILSCRSICYASLVFAVASFCFTSSSTLHNAALENIYRAPMSYFDSTPLGRIISRFTDDIANLDSLLFMQLRMFLFSTSMLLSSIIVVFVYLPWAILCLLPIFIGVFVFLSYFRCASRDLKRINSIFRSTMFSHVTETISGLSTILGYGRTQYFQGILFQSIDDMNVSMNILLTSQIWLSLRVVFCTLPVSFIVSMLCIYRVFPINASTVGMLLNLLPSVVISLALGVPMFTELENQMNSIERIYELAYEIPQEAPSEIPETKPVESWPDEGRIIFDNACLRYRDNLPLALTDCNLDIAPHQKIGVVGRTGAGKSTMLSSLFRITELSSGAIYIDGIDISTIGLSDLRSKLSIIPQDPVLFQGSIRFNLDPFDNYTDVELWDALRRCGAVKDVNNVSKTHKFHLDAVVDSAGGNFSLGERQLLTLARALVRKPKIIVLDEATANVDLETDMMIQNTISREFAGCTIMCIAHRLQTILHYDRVVVMDNGRVLEHDSPYALWCNSDSTFRSMCNEANLTQEDVESRVIKS